MRFANQNSECILFGFPMHAACSNQLIILYLINVKMLGEEYRTQNKDTMNFLLSYITSSVLDTRILLGT
jgi:hypothetical protein